MKSSCLALFVLLVAATAATAEEKPKVGNVVWAEWKPNSWFHGKIAKVDGKDFHIVFDDGDKAVVDASKIVLDRAPKKDMVKVDTRVLAKFSKTRFYPGKITKIDGDNYHIKFDDGDVGKVTLDDLRLPAEQGDAKSSAKLDGKWQVVRQEERGNLVPAEVSKRLSMVIDGNKMEWYIGNPAPNFAATLTIDEEKKTIDAKITRSSFNGKTMLGIYKFEKDQLHMCWGEIGTDKRPEKFATAKPGEGPFNYTVYSRKPIDPEAPPDAGPTKPPAGKKPRLADLKFTLPKGWEAKHLDASNRWEISQGFTPTVLAGWALAKDNPKDLDDYVEKLQKDGDHFAYGLYWTSVTEKGKLPDGLYVVGKVKVKADKEAKRIGFSIIRDLGGEKVIFESFSTYYDDAKLLKEAMDICKAAKY